jgi:membrane protease subunit HflC
MRAERNRRTEATIAQGNAEATRIKTDADYKKTELLAAAQARAKAIRAQGDAKAAKYYKMLEAHPELAMFLRSIETLKEVLKERATIVLPADTEPFKLLKELPDLEPGRKK